MTALTTTLGRIGPLRSTMVTGSDGVFVAAPAWHSFMEQALKGVKDQWYSAPSDVVHKGSDYFLLDAQDIPVLNAPRPSPRPQPAPTGPTVVESTPGYVIPPEPPGQIGPASPPPSPAPSPSPGRPQH